MAMYNLLKSQINFNSVLLSTQIKSFVFTKSYHTAGGIKHHLFQGPSVLPVPCSGGSATVLLRNNNRQLSVISSVSLSSPSQVQIQRYNYRQLQTTSRAPPPLIEMSCIPDTKNVNASGRAFATSPKEIGGSPGPDSPGALDPPTTSSSVNANLSTKEKLKQAVKDYGSTVLVFHVTMSLVSLGTVYALVSSGLDVAFWLEKIGVGASILESKITQGASTFVVAYAIHKVFAPVRITITLGATPFIVKYLRRVGVLKIKAPKAD